MHTHTPHPGLVKNSSIWNELHFLIKKDNFFVTHFSLNENVADSKQNRKSKAKLMYPPKLFRNSKEQKKSRLKYNLAFWLFTQFRIFAPAPRKKSNKSRRRKFRLKTFFFLLFFLEKSFISPLALEIIIFSFWFWFEVPLKNVVLYL